MVKYLLETAANHYCTQGDGVFAEAGECWDVDFMVKFNPKSQPDKYKLSEFTQPGQRKAVIKIDTDDDYMFQVTGIKLNAGWSGSGSG